MGQIGRRYFAGLVMSPVGGGQIIKGLSDGGIAAAILDRRIVSGRLLRQAGPFPLVFRSHLHLDEFVAATDDYMDCPVAAVRRFANIVSSINVKVRL
jgi:hypothetical protein